MVVRNDCEIFEIHAICLILAIFRNAILQSLLALEEFNHALDREIKIKKNDKGLAASYAKLSNEYRNCNEKTIINPSEFKYHMGRKKDRFAGNAQQDAQ
jgi:ubiquitin C-terminal hydrolase